jgi:hypothetical protein
VLYYLRKNKVKKSFIFSFLFLFFGHLSAQNNPVFSFASKQKRDSIKSGLKQMVDQTIALHINEETSSKLTGSFWAMELMLYKPEKFEKRIPELIQQLPINSHAFQRSFLEMLFTLYPDQFPILVEQIWKKLGDDKNKAMALEYLAINNIFPLINNSETFFLSKYYPLYTRRLQDKKPVALTKKQLLNKNFLPGQTALCSFQSNNRDKPGYLMIRTADGKWMKDPNGNILKFQQLARSISNLPYYLTNGNTPQGLFKISGFDTSDNNWIGPTANLQMLMPFEGGNNLFFGTDTAYINYYTSLLGPLSKYKSLNESFEAGKIGRSEIIAHGTTIPSDFYKGLSYYPCTPSLGCLCSPETWDEAGERKNSIQDQWIKIVRTLKPFPQYLIVVNVKNL